MKLYFSGISGVAIGPLALMAVDAGYEVVGSDLKHSSFFDNLESRGAQVNEGQDGSFIQSVHEKAPIDWFVMTAALPDDHPELEFARSNNIRISKRDELINQILDDKSLNLLAVAGTHGKTTTTAMLVWLFKQFDIPISYSVGTTLSFGPSAQYQENSQYFVYEADEFDRNFLKFTPYSSIITTIDFDHPDTYADDEDYNQAFADFAESTAEQVFLYDTDSTKLPQFILDECSIVAQDDDRLSELTLPGAHNRHNALLATEMFTAIHPELDEEDVITAVNSFPGSHRRFERIADNLYSDYAHHPNEIKAMIQMGQELSSHIVIVYQPHQNKRQMEIMQQGGYGETFEGAHSVYWLPTYISRETSDDVIDPQTLGVSSSSTDSITYTQMNEEFKSTIENELKDGALVIAMSAGDLDGWIRSEFART